MEQLERRRSLSECDFVQQYALPGRPVVLEDMIAGWPARHWTPEWLAQRYGDLDVNVSHAARARETPVCMKLADYVRQMRSPADGRPYYLTSWEFPAELMADYALPPYFADNDIERLPQELYPGRLQWIFMGPPGSGFRLHVDVGLTAAWNVQITGRKEWILYAPEDEPYLYNGRPDAFEPDLERFPDLGRARPYTAVLGPGETIFVPSGWWHQTRILETSLSLTGNYVNGTNRALVVDYLRSRGETALAQALVSV